jgi:hypothetical protein
MTYEKPEIVTVGDAKDLVLGGGCCPGDCCCCGQHCGGDLEGFDEDE